MAKSTITLQRGVDIARTYGASRQLVNAWAQHPEFPAPEPGHPGGRIWDGAKVAAWVQEHRPERAGA